MPIYNILKKTMQYDDDSLSYSPNQWLDVTQHYFNLIKKIP